MPTLRLDDHGTLLGWHDLPGRLPALVCLPSLGFPVAENMLPVISHPRLAGFRRILIDLPGSGNSEAIAGFAGTPQAHAGLVARVLDHAGPGPAVIFGHSMGGSVAIALAMARPDLVAHLVVAEGNVTPGGGAASRRIARQERSAFVTSGFGRDLAKLRARACEGDGVAAFLLKGRCRSDPASLHADATGLVDLDGDFAERFFALTIPRTFLFGARSLEGGAGAPDVPDPDLLRRHDIATAVIPRAGHFMTRDNPAAVAGILAGILASILTDRPAQA